MSARDYAFLTEYIELRDGVMHWKPRGVGDFKSLQTASLFNNKYAGRPVPILPGTNGYAYFRLFKIYYSYHRALWVLAHGRNPSGQIDHINGDRTDNRIENLRDCTPSQNAQNARVTRDGLKGVTNCRGRWQAKIRADGKGRCLGTFGTEVEAALAYDEAARDYFGEFASVNFPRAGERSAHLHSPVSTECG